MDWGNPHRPPILLLHGFLSHARTWSSLADHIQPDYHVMALDQRGHGISDWAGNGAYSIDDHFADLAGFVDHLDLQDLILIGHSMGGRNALFYTACRPERVKGLVLVDARPANTDESVLALKHLLDTFRKASPVNTGRAIATREQAGATEDPAPHASYDPNLIVGAERAGYQVEPLWPFMEGLDCPTSILRGEKSTFVSRAEAEMMHRMISGSELVEIRGASHLPMFQNPPAFRAAVCAFLSKLRR